MMITFRVVVMTGYCLPRLRMQAACPMIHAPPDGVDVGSETEDALELAEVADVVRRRRATGRARRAFAVDPRRVHPRELRARDVDVEPVAHEEGLRRAHPHARQGLLEDACVGLAPAHRVG